ncbi:MAG TPA: hypothetical protein VK699_16130 [Terriglobales bacterium]|jgi:hypothetical protein|nr:hypothetical protein [Terriglobales bacterium]
MDFALLFNIVIGSLAILRCVLFVFFYRAFSEEKDVHPIYRQACSATVEEEESLRLEGSPAPVTTLAA